MKYNPQFINTKRSEASKQFSQRLNGSRRKPSAETLKTVGWIAAGVGALVIANAVYRAATKMDLEGKVVLITGGSRGLGYILARQLAQKKAKVAICARSTDQLMVAKMNLDAEGSDVLAITADVTDQERVKVLIDQVVSHYGRIDILINNASIMQVGPFENVTIEDFEKAMNTHFWASLYLIHEVIPYMKKQGGGSIVNITSVGGKVAVPHLLPYTTSKFALVGLSEGLNAELKKSNVQVTTVVPYLMNTGSPRNITVKGRHEEEYAWFKTLGSSPLIAQNADRIANKIVKAIEYRKEEVIFSFNAKMITMLKGVAPGAVNIIMNLFNRFLPEPNPGDFSEKKGYESESRKSNNILTRGGEAAAEKNNEITN